MGDAGLQKGKKAERVLGGSAFGVWGAPGLQQECASDTDPDGLGKSLVRWSFGSCTHSTSGGTSGVSCSSKLATLRLGGACCRGVTVHQHTAEGLLCPIHSLQAKTNLRWLSSASCFLNSGRLGATIEPLHDPPQTCGHPSCCRRRMC